MTSGQFSAGTPNFSYERKFITIDAITLAYWDEGEGRPLVLIHGLGASAEHWGWVMPKLIEKYRVIAIDLPGFGESSVPKPFSSVSTLNDIAPLLLKFIQQLNLVKPILVGHSLGGGCALQTAINYPDDCGGLFLLSSVGFGVEIDVLSKILSVPLFGKIFFHSHPYFIRNFFKSQSPIQDVEQLIQLTHRMYTQKAGLREFHLWLMQEGVNLTGQAHVFTCDQLGSLPFPVSVVWGNNDPMFPPSQIQAKKACFQHANVTILDQTYHNPHIERSDQIASLISDYVNSLSQK
jgi:pimeloyl-ACP methyl ester carboxylesterase